MTDKKTFGSFIKTKRIEKNYSQKDLAELLFVTEGAISKWERGVSYPDITLITDICRVLDISEHELITASTDTDARKIKAEAKKFRIIRSGWFWTPTISYAIALLVCFICNLAVNHTLSWFFIVLTALICAYTFVPTLTFFFKTDKLLVFLISTYLSICLLLFTCAVYTNGLYWFLTACIGVLIGYEMILIPVFLSKTKCTKYKFTISLSIALLLTILLLLNINLYYQVRLVPSILITIYAFIPVILSTLICILPINGLTKTAFCIQINTIMYFFLNRIIDKLFNLNESNYEVNFMDWSNYLEGNVHCITLVSLMLISLIFMILGIRKVISKK